MDGCGTKNALTFCAIPYTLHTNFFMRRVLLIRKIFLAGIVFFLIGAWLPHASAQSESFSYLAKGEQLSNHGDMEVFHHQEKSLVSIEESLISNSPSDPEGPDAKGLEPPIRVEPNHEPKGETVTVDRRKKEPDFDIPIVINDKVEQCIQLYQTKIREKFATWLARSTKYIPFMQNLLKEHGLPEDLVYLSLIESGFNPYAYSRAKAAGLWQFISQTGRRYGLRVNWWVDERRDPEKSTIAAAKYLKDLYEMFACWYLAAAGYNAGEYKIANAIKRYRTEDFWRLTKHPYLKRETKNYVPLMIAAAVVAKSPEKYGFIEIDYQEPLRYEKVKVPELTDLSIIAKACETSLEEIKGLNPELQRGVTPPNEAEYEVKIPFQKKDLFLENFGAWKPNEKYPFKTHHVKKGETLKSIARLYRVDLDPLLQINHLGKSSQISNGMILSIPISKDDKSGPLVVVQKSNGKTGNSRAKK